MPNTTGNINYNLLIQFHFRARQTQLHAWALCSWSNTCESVSQCKWTGFFFLLFLFNESLILNFIRAGLRVSTCWWTAAIHIISVCSWPNNCTVKVWLQRLADGCIVIRQQLLSTWSRHGDIIPLVASADDNQHRPCVRYSDVPAACHHDRHQQQTAGRGAQVSRTRCNVLRWTASDAERAERITKTHWCAQWI